MNKGIALDNLGDYQKAAKAYQNAIEANSNSYMAWNNLGLDLINGSKKRAQPFGPGSQKGILTFISETGPLQERRSNCSQKPLWPI